MTTADVLSDCVFFPHRPEDGVVFVLNDVVEACGELLNAPMTDSEKHWYRVQPWPIIRLAVQALIYGNGCFAGTPLNVDNTSARTRSSAPSPVICVRDPTLSVAYRLPLLTLLIHCVNVVRQAPLRDEITENRSSTGTGETEKDSEGQITTVVDGTKSKLTQYAPVSLYLAEENSGDLILCSSGTSKIARMQAEGLWEALIVSTNAINNTNSPERLLVLQCIAHIISDKAERKEGGEKRADGPHSNSPTKLSFVLSCHFPSRFTTLGDTQTLVNQVLRIVRGELGSIDVQEVYAMGMSIVADSLAWLLQFRSIEPDTSSSAVLLSRDLYENIEQALPQFAASLCELLASIVCDEILGSSSRECLVCVLSLLQSAIIRDVGVGAEVFQSVFYPFITPLLYCWSEDVQEEGGSASDQRHQMKLLSCRLASQCMVSRWFARVVDKKEGATVAAARTSRKLWNSLGENTRMLLQQQRQRDLTHQCREWVLQIANVAHDIAVERIQPQQQETRTVTATLTRNTPQLFIFSSGETADSSVIQRDISYFRAISAKGRRLTVASTLQLALAMCTSKEDIRHTLNYSLPDCLDRGLCVLGPSLQARCLLNDLIVVSAVGIQRRCFTGLHLLFGVVPKLFDALESRENNTIRRLHLFRAFLNAVVKGVGAHFDLGLFFSSSVSLCIRLMGLVDIASIACVLGDSIDLLTSNDANKARRASSNLLSLSFSSEFLWRNLGEEYYQQLGTLFVTLISSDKMRHARFLAKCCCREVAETAYLSSFLPYALGLCSLPTIQREDDEIATRVEADSSDRRVIRSNLKLSKHFKRLCTFMESAVCSERRARAIEGALARFRRKYNQLVVENVIKHIENGMLSKAELVHANRVIEYTSLATLIFREDDLETSLLKDSSSLPTRSLLRSSCGAGVELLRGLCFPSVVLEDDEMMQTLLTLGKRIDHMMTPRYDHLKSIFVSLIQLFLMIPQSGDSIFGHPPQCLQDLRPFISPLPIHQEKFEAAVLALSAHCSPSLEKRMSLITVVLDCLQFNVEQDDRLRRAGYSPIILSLHQPRKLDNNGEVRSDQQHAPDQLQDAVEENETSTDPASCIPPSEICNWPIIATITTDGRLNMEENMVASVRNCYQQYSQLLRSQGVKTLSVNGAQVHVDLLFHDGHELEELRGRRNVAIHQIDSLINNSGGERRAILMDRKLSILAEEDRIEESFHKMATCGLQKAATFTARYQGAFWNAVACCGKGIGGCYAPDGDHCEKPFEIACRRDGGFISIYDDSHTEIENIEVLLTDQGMFTYKVYTNSHSLDTSDVWLQVFQRLLNTNLVPAIIVPLNFPFRRAFAALSRVVPAESFTKEITCREDFIPQCSTYYDMKPQQIRCAHDLLLTKQKLLCHNTKSATSAKTAMITQSPAQVGEDLASFLFSTMLRDFPEELRRFVFLGHALATLVSTMMRSGEMRCEIVYDAFDYGTWLKRCEKSKKKGKKQRRKKRQTEEVNDRTSTSINETALRETQWHECSKQVIVDTVTNHVVETINSFVFSCDLLQLYEERRNHLLDLRDFVKRRICVLRNHQKWSMANALSRRLRQISSVLSSAVSVVVISTLSPPKQVECMYHVFRNEDKVWRSRGGRDGYETVQQYIGFLGLSSQAQHLRSSALSASSSLLKGKKGNLLKQSLSLPSPPLGSAPSNNDTDDALGSYMPEPFPGVLLVAAQCHPWRAESDLGGRTNIEFAMEDVVGYAVGEFVDLRTALDDFDEDDEDESDDEVEDHSEGRPIHSGHHEIAFETVTAWVHDRWRGSGLALVLYEECIVESYQRGAQHYVADVLVGTWLTSLHVQDHSTASSLHRYPSDYSTVAACPAWYLQIRAKDTV